MMEYTVLTSSLAGGLGIRRAVFDMFYENVKPSGVNFLWADASADNPDPAVFFLRVLAYRELQYCRRSVMTFN